MATVLFSPFCCQSLGDDVYAEWLSSQVYANKDEWTKRSILYTAGSGKFSSDRTIYEYAKDIWDVKPVAVPSS